ncbi:MAG TPA: hypothetical protein VHP12_05445 [Chitinophagaceae bacterium]|nr:hypothetical protein [Chitinophagaceae bacterium]
MTNKEIGDFVFGRDTAITISPNKVELIFKDTKTIYGYFENNIYNSDLYNQNNWLFYPTPQDADNKKSITIDGNNLVSITLKSLS